MTQKLHPPFPLAAFQVLDLLDAVESLKVGIMNGDGVALNKVEQAVGKVAGGIDVYLILAVSADDVACFIGAETFVGL